VSIGTVAFIAWTTTVPKGTLDGLGGPVWVGTLIVILVSALLTIVVRVKAVWVKKPGAGPTPAPQPAPAPGA
jgi:hypothetical protein